MTATPETPETPGVSRPTCGPATAVSVDARGLKRCKDCASPTRKAPHPGPRCATCHRQRTRAVKDRAFDQRLRSTYGITAKEYWAIYAAQGGRCAFGCRATGATKRLAVDHDHGGQGSARHQRRQGLTPAPEAMRSLVRGLLCGPHNMFLAEIGDDPQVFRRIAEYLESRPAQGVLAP